MKLRFSFAIAVLFMLALMAPGCSQAPTLLDTVPADAPWIVTINAERLMNALDGKAYGGELTADETIDKFLTGASERGAREIKTVITSGAIDRKLMVGFIASDGGSHEALAKKGKAIYTFKIHNLADLLSEIGATGAPQQNEGFDGYRLEDVNLFVKGDQGWLIPGDAEKGASELSAELSRASNTPASGVKPIAEWLRQHDDIARVAGVLSDNSASGWTCAGVNVDDAATTIKIDAKIIMADGTVYGVDKCMTGIDGSMLDYTMPTDLFIAAVGLRADTDWASIVDYLSSLYPLDYRQRAAFAVALPYLKRLDGTVLVAVGPTLDERLDHSARISDQLNFFVGFQVKKGEAESTLRELVSALSMIGVNPVATAGGGYSISAPGIAPVNLIAIDNRMIAVSNRPLNQLGNDAARKLLKGNCIGVWADIPNALAESTYGGRGFRLNLTADETAALTFALNGSTAPILEQFAMMVAAGDNEK